MRPFRVLLLCPVLLLALSAATGAVAGEYFLDAAQKRELLMDGRITGREGAQYDVWLVPGYRVPAQMSESGWHHGRDALRWYRKPEYVPDMLDATRKTMRYAHRDVLQQFALQGSNQAWGQASLAAAERVRRRVFGWQFAWPWAVLQASTESAVRVGLGLPGGALLWGAAPLAVPAGYLLTPAVVGVGAALGEGVVVPVAVAGWNTVAGVPLALIGEQPAPERADGWWITRLRDPAEADILARLAQWQHGWQDAPDIAAGRAALAQARTAHDERLARLRRELAAENETWARDGVRQSEAVAKLQAERALAALPALDRAMAEAGYGRARLEAQHAVLLQGLVAGGLDEATARRVLAGWLSGVPPAARPAGEKTDPLRQALDAVP